MTDSSALLVARFLRTNGYTQSFAAFIDEAGLSEEDGDTRPQDLTIERLLEEKRAFDKSISFEKLNLTDKGEVGWSEPAPSQSTRVAGLTDTANVLSIVVDQVVGLGEQVMLASASDKTIRATRLRGLETQEDLSTTTDAPVLAQATLANQYHFATTMSGELYVRSLLDGKLLQKRRDHNKFVVSVQIYQDDALISIATAGWDKKLLLYKVASQDQLDRGQLADPVASIELDTKPEAVLFVQDPDTRRPILVVTRTDSSHLFFYDTRDGLRLLGKQNLAPYSNAWVAFTPASIALSPTDAGVIAVATNSTPNMRVIVVRLLLPSQHTRIVGEQTPIEQARGAQALADRENSAITLQCNTMAPQSPFSTPIVVWRPTGKGVWVNSDDGVVRGIDTVTGKVIQKLQAHVDGTKVRTLCAGMSQNADQPSEWLISGGFDHNVFVWTTRSQ